MSRGTWTDVRAEPVPRQTKTYIGIDNGVSGSVAILNPGAPALLFPTPIFLDWNYTKEKKRINRIDRQVLKNKLEEGVKTSNVFNVFVLMERPMVSPQRFQASVSALRALEATLGVLEDLGYAFQYIDSREWQKKLLPSGCKGDALKSAAVAIARRLFPHIQTKDADALLIAEHARRLGL